MHAHRRLLLAGATALLLLTQFPSVHAFDRTTSLQRTTVLRFATDVQVPGARLSAGTYVFELADPLHARELVSVTSRDRGRVALTMFTRIVNRPADLGAATVVWFAEDADGAPALAVWWPAGESTGRRFVYKSQ